MDTIFDKIQYDGGALPTIFGIEETVDGDDNIEQKQVHFYGYGYYTGSDEEYPCRFVEYTWFYIPLIDVIQYGINDVESEGAEHYKQYISIHNEDELRAVYDAYDDGKAPQIIHELTMDMPCGIYVLVNE